MNSIPRIKLIALPKTYLYPAHNIFYTRTFKNLYDYNLCARRPFYKATSRIKPMHIRRISAAIIFGIISYKGWQSSYSQAGYLRSGTVLADPQNRPSLEKKVVVVDARSMYTDSIPANEPIQKETLESGKKMVKTMNLDEATQRLRQNEESYLVGRDNGVERYDLVQLPSNDPIEDDHAEKIFEMSFSKSDVPLETASISDWMFWGVFDGHSGWTTSASLRQVLINFVARELNSTYQATKPTGSPSNESIHAAIKAGFTLLDDEIVINNVGKALNANSKSAAAKLLAPALSGSCALLSFYDSSSKLLHVACTGDSRAVLGRQGASGKWVATPLSIDQTGSNPDEEERMRKEHPGEEHVIRYGRVLGGLEPTRAFGDATYKWSRETSELIKTFFFGRTPSKLLQTPPYVTAEPVVTTTQIYPERNDFLVMATDGLWEMLSNEEVIGLVGKWIEEQKSKNKNKLWANVFRNNQEKGLPVEWDTQKTANQKPDGNKIPIRQQQWGINSENQQYVVEDENVATHIVRNALGGGNSEMLCALLTLPSPYSRRYRDDLTVQVIFFGEKSDKSGNVLLNKEASASISDVKAKL